MQFNLVKPTLLLTASALIFACSKKEPETADINLANLDTGIWDVTKCKASTARAGTNFEFRKVSGKTKIIFQSNENIAAVSLSTTMISGYQLNLEKKSYGWSQEIPTTLAQLEKSVEESDFITVKYYNKDSYKALNAIIPARGLKNALKIVNEQCS